MFTILFEESVIHIMLNRVGKRVGRRQSSQIGLESGYLVGQGLGP